MFPEDSIEQSDSADSTIIDSTQTPTVKDDLIGCLLGKWKIEMRLGAGGMGEVYLALRTEDVRQRAAIKLLQSGASQESRKRFLRERQILADLNHPNIARLLDAGIYENRHWIAMEYIDGESLKQYLRRKGPLPSKEIIRITCQIASGLEAAHSQKIIHRDIKPDNIMLQAKTYEVKILDFGISKQQTDYNNQPSADGESYSLTQPGEIFGTPAYMSSEQAAGQTGNRIDHRSDIYSLGLVIYEMLTGRPVFQGHVLDVLVQQREKSPEPPSQRHPQLNIPKVVDQVVLKALEKDPAKRQQRVEEFAEQLAAAFSEPLVPLPERRRYRFLVPALMLTFLCFMAVISYLQRPVPSPIVSPPSGNIAAEAFMYQILRQKTDGSLEPVMNKQISEGDIVQFEFQSPLAGSFYFICEEKSRNRLIWINPTMMGQPQQVSSGQKIRVPEREGIRMGAGTGQQDYIALYVPANSQWKMEKFVEPHKLEIRQPIPAANFLHAFIRGTEAQRILQVIYDQGSSLPEFSRQGDVMSLKLTNEQASAITPLIWYRFSLDQRAPHR
jgi:serine/threonine protein kinase